VTGALTPGEGAAGAVGNGVAAGLVDDAGAAGVDVADAVAAGAAGTGVVVLPHPEKPETTSRAALRPMARRARMNDLLTKWLRLEERSGMGARRETEGP